MKPVLWIIRGLPGSGKSTFASQLAASNGHYHCEADQYFVGETGVYNFDHKKLGQAHDWCIKEIHDGLKMGKTCVVSNTFTTISEIENYLFWGLIYDINIVEMTRDFGSVHSVPDISIERMRRRWVPNSKLDIEWPGGSIVYVTI